MDNVAGIVVGFVLTTIVGGAWAAWLQQRSWKQQNEVQLREAERERAGTACQDITSLLDRRMYRMRRLLWAATQGDDGAIDLDELEQRRRAYLDVLLGWNDRLNTNLSLIGTYFGDEARAELETLYAEYQRAGQAVEMMVRKAKAGEATVVHANRIDEDLTRREPGSLNDRVYRFGLLLMGQLRDGLVGRHAPRSSSLPTE